jgi:hypothetical protein
VGEPEGGRVRLELGEEAQTLLLPAPDPRLGRPVPTIGVVDVDRHDLGGAAALHLESPEAVPRAHVEAALALQRLGQGDDRHRRAQIEPAGSDDAGRELEDVVPGKLRGASGEVLGGYGRR